MHLYLKQQKRILLFILLFLVTGFAYTQETKIRIPKKTRNIIWFTPNAAHQVNGVAIGLQALSVNENDRKLFINGLNADMGILSLMGLPYAVDYWLSSKSKRKPGVMECDTAETIINGLSLSMGGEVSVTVNGINVAGIVTLASSLNGVSVTALFSHCSHFRGIVIAGIHNNAKKGTGLQIGLFNKCEKLKGLQIGLWNKSGKRGLPFLNWGA
jgi:hypothetical protein